MRKGKGALKFSEACTYAQRQETITQEDSKNKRQRHMSIGTRNQ